MAMIKVSDVIVGTNNPSSIEFTAIPQTGKDLLIVFSGRSSSAGSADCYLQINSNYESAKRRLLGTGSAVSSTTDNPIFRIAATSYTANTFGSTSIYIPNYTATGSTKVALIDSVVENNATLAEWASIIALSSTSTTAVTQVAVGFSATLAQYSTAGLYIIS